MKFIDKQKEIRKLVSLWKRKLCLWDYSHKTYFKNESEDEIFKTAAAFIQISEQAKQLTITINNQELRKLTIKRFEHNIIHELCHKFYASIWELFSEITNQMNEETKTRLNKKFDDLEHKEIFKLVRIFKKLK